MRLVNKMNTILLFLKTYRKKISNITFYKEIIFILFYICISLFAILSVEEIFFLTSVKRKILFTLFLTTSILFLLYPIIKWIISYNGLFNNNKNNIKNKFTDEDRLGYLMIKNKNKKKLIENFNLMKKLIKIY